MSRRARQRAARAVAAALGAVVVPAAMPAGTPACRCIPRTLAEYYAAADEVLMARLVGAEERSEGHVLHFEVAGTAWKGAPFRASLPRTGDRLVYRTAASSASCGVPIVPDGIYLLFGWIDPEGGDVLGVDTCSGTRVHLAPGGEPVGFDDVPARFVPGQLNALGGLDVLRDASANAPREDDPANGSLVGLLDLKGLAHGGVVPVRAARDTGAEPIAVIRGYDDVESREYAYEQPGAVVLARIDGWHRVRLAGGAAGWIAPEDGGTYFPYAELPIRRLTYLTGHWSGYVWPEPGAGLPVRSPRRHAPGRPEYAAEVHESMLLGGMPWFRLDVLRGNPCDGGETSPELTGWVPGYGADGQPTVWFFSRGC